MILFIFFAACFLAIRSSLKATKSWSILHLLLAITCLTAIGVHQYGLAVLTGAAFGLVAWAFHTASRHTMSRR